ncbi:hypothetical protein N7523_010904 [Penicillium sp. IBT 18751x]|nr:hypothetical protein N7523_010904 [Penicillium sp. IBT 18751x]
MRELVAIESKMLFGSIYFASDAVKGAVPTNLTNEAPAELKEHIYKTFSIRPTIDRGFWKKERTLQISQGVPVSIAIPLWSTLKDYMIYIGHREIEWIKNYAVPKPSSDATLVSLAQNNPEAYLQLLEKYLKYGDLHSYNLFMDEGHITSVIDWQSVGGPTLPLSLAIPAYGLLRWYSTPTPGKFS